jgi:hypothetical protein
MSRIASFVLAMLVAAAAQAVLAVFVAVTAIPERRKGTAAVLSFFGLSTPVTMSWTTFAINSHDGSR